MITTESKYEVGDIVKVAQYKTTLVMVIMESVECLAGWRYKCGFPRKDGKPHRRRTPLWEREKNIIKKIDFQEYTLLHAAKTLNPESF